ncbi:uncharacterized protein BXZ73DRAFT_101806 [Epithele typhae]|uniref:uncharacterized protein n=1 Tax=Epithele typhae TaxID=378194 RepID=UPI002007A618|nr:uncharacterized protein BXZ73DRAFT_101806 [Epithele typhae]KAH9930431.1 hypothetical protein BXZ73DRAFT_101806 [Epithele typhae]
MSTPSTTSPSPELTSGSPPYLIRTALLPPPRSKPLSLGDTVGLTRTGVHLCRLPAGATSTTLHWHTHDDEWPDGWEDKGKRERAQEGVVPREEPVRTGDFVGFKAA